jgi:hypothetical protein
MMRTVDKQQVEILLPGLEEEGNCSPSCHTPHVRDWSMVGKLASNVLDFFVYHPQMPCKGCIIP